MNDEIRKNEINASELEQVTGGTADGESTVIVSVSGRLNTYDSPGIQQFVESQIGNANTLILEMSGVEFINLTGVRMLLALRQIMIAKNGSFRLRNVIPEVASQIKRSGFGRPIEIE